MTVREKELPAHPQGQCVHQKDSGSLVLHLSPSPLTSLTLPCSSLSPEDSTSAEWSGWGHGQGLPGCGWQASGKPLLGPGCSGLCSVQGGELVPGA